MTAILVFGLLIWMAGCALEETEISKTEIVELEAENKELKSAEENEIAEKTCSGTEKVLDAFINNEIPLSGEKALYYKDIMQEDGTELGDRVDLDNDGENELIIMNYYGGYYIDVRDDEVCIFVQGTGTARMLHYIEYDDAIWIYHSDTSHLGRQIYEFEKYEGGDKLVDSFDLKDEYWDDINHVYTYRGKEISKEEYDRIFGEIFGTENTEVANEKNDIESDIQNIREIYDSIQAMQENSSLYSSEINGYAGDGRVYRDQNGRYKKITVQKGFYYSSDIGEALPNYSAEYYYGYNTCEELAFVFVYDGNEEYRYYLEDGKCIRYIDADGTVTDYPNGAESGTIAYTDCFIREGEAMLWILNEEIQE